MNKRVELYRQNDWILGDCMERILTSIENRRITTGDQLFLLSGCSTGSGTTMCTIQMAIAFAEAGYRTLLVDCDSRKDSKYKRLCNEKEKGLSHFLLEDLEFKEIAYSTIIPNLTYIPIGGDKQNPIYLFRNSRIVKFLKEAKESYEIILLDFPSIRISPEATLLFHLVDGIILIASLNETTEKELLYAKDQIISYQEKYYGLIVNKISLSDLKGQMRDYDYYKQPKMIHRYIMHLKKRKC